MGFMLHSLIMPIVTILVLFIGVLVAYLKYFAFTYWEKKGVPFSPPSIPGGNINKTLLGRETLGIRIDSLYKEFRAKGHKHAGIYFINQPLYLPLDPDIIKNILMKDFQHFVDRGVYFDEEQDPLSAHLFAIEGIKWKNMRAKLSPTFTSGKMKMMFEILVACSNNLDNFCADLVKRGESLDIKDVMARYTTDIIAICAFGLDCDSMKDPNNEFRVMGRKFFNVSFSQAIKGFLGMGYPDIIKFFKLRVMDKDVADFFMRALTDTINYRENNKVSRNDFLQLLIQLKNQGCLEGEFDGQTTKTPLSMTDVMAQAFVFFVAGFETSSTTMTFCLYELAQNQDIQDKVREEVRRVFKQYDGKMTYECLQNMPYLDKVVNEAMRKYPPVPFLNRKCTSEHYTVPGTSLTLNKGDGIIIPVLGLQRDPEYYPNPDKFDPERFNEENKAGRHPCVFLPFGEGPRICIGLRFGLMQTKAGLATILNNYILSINPKTKFPMKYSPISFILTSSHDILLDIKKLA